MLGFRIAADELAALTTEAMREPLAFQQRIHAALDGEPGRKLRAAVPISELRASGAFFTGSVLADFALRAAATSLSSDSVIFDPACGAGDLLVACAKRLPLQRGLDGTVAHWGSQLLGCDLHDEFVEAARSRLILTAIDRGMQGRVRQTDCFGGIRKACGLISQETYKAATHVVINPPFTMIPAPEGCEWASGKVNLAAVFVETALKYARPETRLVAILPEVLRGGSRYERWRKLIQSLSRLNRIESFGLFDRWADVDVFVLDVTATTQHRSSKPWLWARPSSREVDCLANRFEIGVGPVVPYRDAKKGPVYPFATARNVAAWQEVKALDAKRRYAGRTSMPPFVVVRRTSRVGDKHRAIGTIIRGKSPVAVENHLIVLKPNDNTLSSCRELLTQLKRDETTKWLDRRLCCRHLTVSAIRELPWWGEA